MFKRKMRFLNEKGQTAMEYMLIMVVVLTIGIAFKKKIEEFILTNPNSLLSKQLNGLTSAFEADTSGRYLWFPLM